VLAKKRKFQGSEYADGIVDIDRTGCVTGLAVLAVFAFAALVILMVLPLWRARRAAGRPVPGLETVLPGRIRGRPRLLVYFWSPTCGICRGMTPIIDRLVADDASILKVNIVEHPDIAREFWVLATPSVAVVEHGVIQQLVVGGRDEQSIRSLLNQ